MRVFPLVIDDGQIIKLVIQNSSRMTDGLVIHEEEDRRARAIIYDFFLLAEETVHYFMI